MKIKVKLTVFSVLYSILIICIMIGIFATTSLRFLKSNILNQTQQNVASIVSDVEHELHHYITVAEVIELNDIVVSSLADSNAYYDGLSETDRTNEITSENNLWLDSDSSEDPIKQKYLNTELSSYLQDLNSSEVDYFGEIFVTNKHGLVVGTSSELSTIAHAHKYWWEGAYNDNDPLIYFDDRGYDVSVGAVVLGIVYPIRVNNEFSGLLKINIKVTAMLDDHITVHNNLASEGEYIIVRNSGDIVSQKNVIPLSTSISEDFITAIEPGTFLGTLNIDGDSYYVGSSNITLSSIDEPTVFGGSSETSIDHHGGETNSQWKALYMADYNSLNTVSRLTIINTMVISLIFTVLIAIIAIYLSTQFSNRIISIQEHTEHLRKGDYKIHNHSGPNDELGVLAKNLNDLSVTLKNNTISIENYKAELELRMKLQEELDKASLHDELTGIYNRRAFNEFFTKYHHQSIRSNNPLGFVILDIDDFKNVNDNYGHLQGDKVLQALANKITKITRENDIFCRWGGEEFVILISDTSKEKLLEFSEKIRTQISKLKVHPVKNITISLGATVSREDDNLDSIITRADKNLYKAKNNGKNQTQIT